MSFCVFSLNIVKMSEALEPVAEQQQEQEVPKESKEPEEVEPLPKKRGRPAGSKDKAPRQKTVRVKVEPLVKEPAQQQQQEPAKPEEPKPEHESPKKPEPIIEPEIEEPPSPRSLIAYHSSEVVKWKGNLFKSKAEKYEKNMFHRCSMPNVI